MYLFEPLDRIIQGYLPPEQIERVKRAYVIARDAHEGKHALAVSLILLTR